MELANNAMGFPPKLSIITINLNNASGLRKTMESVKAQSFRDFEWIVIDGGSSDESVELITHYGDMVDFWVSEPDKGIYNAMNKGIKAAHGHYLQFLNSGDCLCDGEALSAVFSVSRMSDILFGNCNLVKDDKIIEERKYPDIMSLKEILDINIVHNCMFFKRNLFEKELYDEQLYISSDFKFLLKKVLQNCSIEHVNRTIVGYDVTGVSSKSFSILLQEKELIMKELLSPCILKDLEHLDYLEDESMERIQRYRKSSRLYHKLVTANLMLIGFLERVGIR